MGQYFKIVNLDKGEYLDPTSFPFSGRKLGEFGHQLILGFSLLLARSDGRLIMEDSDLCRAAVLGEAAQNDTENFVPGRWAGDRVLMIGDHDSSGLYQRLKGTEYRNISQLVLHYLKHPTEKAVGDQNILPAADGYIDPFEE